MLIVVRRKDQVEDGALERFRPLVCVLFDDRSVVHGTVVLADGQVRSLMLVKLDHKLVKLKLQILLSDNIKKI